MERTLYKWLKPGRLTAMVDFKWPVAKGRWTESERVDIGINGWHAVSVAGLVDHMPWVFGSELWTCEIRGRTESNLDGALWAGEQMRLVERVGVIEPPNLRRAVVAIGAEVGWDEDEMEWRFALGRPHEEDRTTAWLLIHVASRYTEHMAVEATKDAIRRSLPWPHTVASAWTSAAVAARTTAGSHLLTALAGDTGG